ncbi:G2/M phase-specific E3 ubiquitin-protein ligase-like [Gadus macrocephalus]|uniref:G2/M phase-specific E3 ubiquitin-protein ligase-like n=1 Tax=Gadus macrocephalus TaxID=80720 RepID=UPI0028CB3C86|nr:G2/M phase-specific E3 ubiquitin-protein ligase-like [Gadus macrocephalus]
MYAIRNKFPLTFCDRLLMLEVQSSLGIFEGRPGELFFSYDLQALDQNKFYTAGKLTAWSIIHNGPGLRCLNNSLFALMCNQEVDLTNLDLGLLPIESDDQSKIDQIKTCSTEEDLETLKQVCGDWIAGCGVPTVYTANLQDLPRVLNRVVAHFIFHRVASMIQQFTAGMNSCGRFWDLVKSYWRQFVPVFTHTGEKLTRHKLLSLFIKARSEEGSNRWEMEESTLYLFEDWLLAIEGAWYCKILNYFLAL